MITEQDLLNNKWVSTADGYVKLGVTLVKIYDEEWECHYTVGTEDVLTMNRKYHTLEELYDHIKQAVGIILSPNYRFVRGLTSKQKRTLKNWIL